MDETTMLVLAAASAPALPALLKSVYADLLQPSVRRVGLALEDVIGLGNTALYPVQLLNGRTSIALKSNFDKYRKKLEDVLDADIIRVAPEVGVPIAEKLAYVTEPKLSDFYVTLLAKASQRQFAFQAHPGFVKAIDHLSPDDAAMIEHFASGTGIPFSRAIFSGVMSSEYVGCKDLLLPAAMCDGLAYPDNASAYVSNLASLGLIDIERNDAMKDEQAYAELEEHWRTKLPRSNPADAAQLLKFRRGVLTLTDFGVLFINACHEAK